MGIVRDALENSEHAENTIVIFVGDHGWMLGEKQHWGKYRHYDQASRTTMIIYAPDAAGNGRRAEQAVSLLDVYPTLATLAGLDPPGHLEGNSLLDLLENPRDAAWNKPVTIRLNGIDVIKSNDWRYVRSGEKSQLYDMANDPYEWTNLYGDPNYHDLIQELEAQL